MYPTYKDTFFLSLNSALLPAEKPLVMETPAAQVNDLTAEKLKAIDVQVTEVEDDSLINSPTPEMNRSWHRPSHSRAASPTGSVTSMRSMSSRRFVSGSRSSSFHSSYHHEFSKELTAQAESKFFALMELMASASREASSLKEVWSKLLSERESWSVERTRFFSKFKEYERTIKTYEHKHKEYENHGHEHEERKKEVAKLKLEISVSQKSVLEYKSKLHERDNELAGCQAKIAKIEDQYTYSKTQHEKTKTELQETQLSLVAVEEARDHALADARKHHGEIRTLTQKITQLQSTHTELTSKHESTVRELTSVKESLEVFKKKSHEWMHEKGELEERCRKHHFHCEELKRKVKEITEEYELKVREIVKINQTVSSLEVERSELIRKVETWRQKYEESHAGWDKCQEECGHLKIKCSHFEQEITSLTESIRLIRIERNELHETITKKTEELRLRIIDIERLEEEKHEHCKRADDYHRQILVLSETVRRHEVTIETKSEEIQSLTERVQEIELECTHYKTKCSDYESELSSLNTTIVNLKAEIEVVIEDRNTCRARLHECETKYKEVTETITEYEEGGSEWEYEIETLRTMLREAREQKEKAISARNSADRERDESIRRYEEKCREMERFEESVSQHFHAHGGRSGGRTVVREVSYGSTSGSHSHSHGHGHDHESHDQNLLR